MNKNEYMEIRPRAAIIRPVIEQAGTVWRTKITTVCFYTDLLSAQAALDSDEYARDRDCVAISLP